ncbi:MAG: PAS domain S-box protein, partial [Balneolaceae bacterium]|nr:PAS domain S-box protein [Balneolaceae bacterium]
METAIAKKLRSHTWTIVLLYVLIGTCWIFFSDALANTLFTDQQVANVQLYKGTFFILITATFLFFVIRRKNQSIQSLFANVRRSMKDFRDTFEQTAVGIAHMSVNGEWIRINKKLCNILGYSRSELLSTPI